MPILGKSCYVGAFKKISRNNLYVLQYVSKNFTTISLYPVKLVLLADTF